MSRPRWLIGPCLALAAAGARAEPPDPRAINARAEAAFALAQYNEAALAYEEVFKLRPQPALLYNAAQAHRLAGNKERALILYQNYLRVYGAVVSNRGEVEGHIAALERAIASATAASHAPPLMTASPSVTGRPALDSPVAAGVARAPAAARPGGRRALLWVLVGGAVALVAAGVAVAVVLATGESDPVPSLATMRVEWMR